MTPSLTRLSCTDAANQHFELVVCFTSTCDGITYVVLQSIAGQGDYGPEGGQLLNGQVYYEMGTNQSQCQQVTFRYSNAVPPSTIILNTVYQLPSGDQHQQSFPLPAPSKPCC